MTAQMIAPRRAIRTRPPSYAAVFSTPANFIRASVTLISYSFTGPPPPPCTESFYTAPPTTQSGERGILSPGPTCTSCTEAPDSVPPPDLYRDGGGHRGRESVRAVQRVWTRCPEPTCTGQAGRESSEPAGLAVPNGGLGDALRPGGARLPAEVAAGAGAPADPMPLLELVPPVEGEHPGGAGHPSREFAGRRPDPHPPHPQP